jgi:hypothetical protein
MIDAMVACLQTFVFGTGEPVAGPERLSAGALSLDWTSAAARTVSWHGAEVVRGISWPIRDESWATYPAVVTRETVRKGGSEFEVVQECLIAGGMLSSHLVLLGRAEGTLQATIELTAHATVCTNRAGLTVLHPLEGLVGSEFTVLHPDGSKTSTRFPVAISPSQLGFDISGLRYSLEGINIAIDLSGDVFEMEDQRNWSDASFKTYCRPLSFPTPYALVAGETYRQEILIQVQGNAPRSKQADAVGKTYEIELGPSEERVPTIAVAMDGTALPDWDECALTRILGPRILQLRVDPDSAESVVKTASCLMQGAQLQVELELVIPPEIDLDAYLAEIANRFRRAGIPLARVLALPDSYLRSYQPNGPWPGGPTPRDACLAARSCFPQAQIGGGVLTNFAEFNRCRPDVSICDYVSHGSCAILHAADDQSVLQSLEGLSHVFASGRAVAQHRDYRLGLVSIGLRTNPYGEDVAPNPRHARVAAARRDPRQRGLFGAAWAVGAMAATASHGLASIALATPVGPLGMICQRDSSAPEMCEEFANARVVPLFHVIRAFSQMADSPRLSLDLGYAGLVGVASGGNEGGRLVIANLTDQTRVLRLPAKGRVRRLDERSVADALTDPDWLSGSEANLNSEVSVGAFNVAFVELSKGAR